MEDLTKEFVAESREGLERMELCLTELEQRHGDGELVGEIFRVVHTIKGTTGFLGFGRLQTLAHAGENLLAALRDGRVAVSTELISGLLELRDGLQAILEIVDARGSEGERHDDDDSALIGWMKELEGGRKQKDFNSHISESRCGAPGARLGSEGQDRNKCGDSSPIRLGSTSLRAENDKPNPGPAADVDRTLRIEVDELNRMMNMVGDLVLTRNRMMQCQPGDESYPEQVRRLNAVTTELRESVMRARMQPVAHLFAKFPRMVRDLAQLCVRRVRVEFEGQETALDKTLLEAVRDPLTHAVRNAVDHGIEPEAERLKAGKPGEGVVRLKAYQQNGAVVIEVMDDGGGIATERVLAKAVERGLITAETAAGMTEREAQQLIFTPGFSTAREVTSVSGRGVGMDVVRRNVEEAGGRVEVDSRAGVGTTLRLRVPLTLAIIPALVVECGGQAFALPQGPLVELVHVPASEAESAVERAGATELYRLRERLLPLVRLEQVLGLGPRLRPREDSHPTSLRDAGHPTSRAQEPPPRGFYVAVLEPEGRRFGLVVEGLRPPEEIVVKPLSAALKEIGLYAGAAVLGSGTLAMVLDSAEIAARAGVNAAEEERFGRGAARAAAEGANAATAATEDAMVLCETSMGGEMQRMALPLKRVERIMTVPREDVEYAGARALLQHEGELLPLEDEGGVLPRLKAEQGAAATVVICMGGEQRRVGIVVDRVLDVCAGEVLPADAAVSAETLARVRDRITVMHRGFGADGSAWRGLEGAA